MLKRKGLILVAPKLDYFFSFIDKEQINSQHWQKLQQTYPRPITWICASKRYC